MLHDFHKDYEKFNDIIKTMPLVSSNPDHVEMARMEKELEAHKALLDTLRRENQEMKLELGFTNRMLDKLLKAITNGY